MTDKELLGLAAKAAGIDKPDHINTCGSWVFYEPRKPNWNPLTDDGDALRLAVKLDFDLCLRRYGAFVNKIEQRTPGDPYAAARRAIVRAAAEIGKATP